jgi:hypothetical protein
MEVGEDVEEHVRHDEVKDEQDIDADVAQNVRIILTKLVTILKHKVKLYKHDN